MSGNNPRIPPQPILVRTLLGHGNVELALQCLGSMQRFSRELLRFALHDDGTLTTHDYERLVASLGESVLVAKQEADQIAFHALKNHPWCTKFRRENVLAPKLFDIQLMSDSPHLAFCDTDVYFRRPFVRLFSWPDDQTEALFMSDIQSAYALRPWHLPQLAGARLPAKLNTGLIFLRRKLLDLDYVEWFLSKNWRVFHRLPKWLEQTCWMMLASRARCRFWHPDQVRVISSPQCVEEDLVAGHFTSGIRHLLPQFIRRSDDMVPPAEMITVAPDRENLLHYSWESAKRVIGQRLQRIVKIG